MPSVLHPAQTSKVTRLLMVRIVLEIPTAPWKTWGALPSSFVLTDEPDSAHAHLRRVVDEVAVIHIIEHGAINKTENLGRGTE
jgi:hypothetical protein